MIPSKDIIIGVDGGATTTKCVVTELDGNVIYRNIAGPCNQGFMNERKKHLIKTLKDLFEPISNLLNSKVKIKSICLGMAGLNVGLEYELVERITNELLNPEKINVLVDMEIAFQGASLGNPGIIIYAGTGVFGYGKDNHDKIGRVNGWGYIVDDEGGGYDIGRKALQASFRAQDGRGKNTVLVEKILKSFSCSSLMELCQLIYSANGIPNYKIGNLAYLVSESAKEGDRVSQDILENVGRELALCVIALKKKLKFEETILIYPCGGVFKAGHFVMESFKELLSKKIRNFKLQPPIFPPEVGALLFAANELKLSINNSFIDNLLKEYNQSIINF